MSWLYLVLIAQFINAVVTLVDRYLVGPQKIMRPSVYAFYVCLLSGAALFLLPLGIISPPILAIAGLSFLSGLAQVVFLVFIFRALSKAEASDVAPVLGAVSAIATFLLSFLVLQSRLTGGFFAGFIFLVLGTVLMSYFRFSPKILRQVCLSGAMFGFSSVLIKFIFNQTDFWNGFFWTRMGNIAAALLLLLPAVWGEIKRNLRTAGNKIKLAVVANRALAGLAFILILWAIDLGDVSIVNALGGLQFVFLIIIALLFVKKIPGYLHESVRHKTAVVQKAVATALIVVGYVMLFL